jgi:hypothetical protein
MFQRCWCSTLAKTVACFDMQGLRRHLLVPKSFAAPICHVPAGSGNGMSATCGLWNLVTAVHALIKGSVQAVDAASTLYASETVPRLSFLSLQYGLIPDLDFGTEHLRSLLGGERFTYGAIKEVLKFKKHKANIAFCKEPAVEFDFDKEEPGCASHSMAKSEAQGFLRILCHSRSDSELWKLCSMLHLGRLP